MGQSRSYCGFKGEANLDIIAVLIPCYNEEKTVEKVVRDFRQVLPEAVIYVYDNNSSDRTVELAEKAGAVVRHEYLQGKGNVIRRMFREIDAEVYIMTDGDDTYPAEFASAGRVCGDRTGAKVPHIDCLRLYADGSYSVCICWTHSGSRGAEEPAGV